MEELALSERRDAFAVPELVGRDPASSRLHSGCRLSGPHVVPFSFLPVPGPRKV